MLELVKELIEDYERRLASITEELKEIGKTNESFGRFDKLDEEEKIKRLSIKSGNYRTFIGELKRIIQDTEMPLINDDTKPKKLIRSKIKSVLKDGEFEEVLDIPELNKLYALKVNEELNEIQDANHLDIMEFVDLIDVCYAFAKVNGFDKKMINFNRTKKGLNKGDFYKLVLNNLNPSNPSNKIYFK